MTTVRVLARNAWGPAVHHASQLDKHVPSWRDLHGSAMVGARSSRSQPREVELSSRGGPPQSGFRACWKPGSSLALLSSPSPSQFQLCLGQCPRTLSALWMVSSNSRRSALLQLLVVRRLSSILLHSSHFVAPFAVSVGAFQEKSVIDLLQPLRATPALHRPVGGRCSSNRPSRPSFVVLHRTSR